MKTDLSTLPKVEDVYITMLPGDNFKDVAKKAYELVKFGFNPVIFDMTLINCLAAFGSG